MFGGYTEGSRGKSATYLHRNSIGRPVHIGCGEAKQPKPGPDKAILAAIVINQPFPVIATVVFDCQALSAIKKVWTAHKTTSIIVDRNLNFRPREARKYEEHS